MSADISTEAVAKMLEGVTPGPWVVEIDKRTWGWVDVIGPSINVGAPTRATDLCLADEAVRKADARFIAWAREALPALAALLAEAQGLIYAARQERDAAEDQEKELAEELRTVKRNLAELEANMAVLTANKDAAHHWRRENLARAEAAEAREAKLREALANAAGALDGAGEELAKFANVLSRDPWQANQAYESAVQARAALQEAAQ